MIIIWNTCVIAEPSLKLKNYHLFQNTNVQNAKSKILREISHDWEPQARPPHPFDRSDEMDLVPETMRRHDRRPHERWVSGHHHRRKNRFSEWSPWSRCHPARCMQMRERYCSTPRRCGSDKQIETRSCKSYR